MLVGINFRLGVPGFAVLDGAPTNLGVRDQIAALQWVRDNVAAFGGNPNLVTVFGESSGGASVATLMAAPAARGLFHRAIVQSSGGASVCSPDDARLVSAEVAAHLGVPTTAEAFAALDPQAVAAAQSAVVLAYQADPDPQRWAPTVVNGGSGIMCLMPVVDGDLIPGVPLAGIAEGSAAGIPLLIGTTREEFRLFLVPTGVAGALTAQALPSLAARYGWPSQAIATYAANRPQASPGDIACAILTDAVFRAPATRLAAAQQATGGRSICTSSGGQRPWGVWGPATPSSSGSSSRRSAAGNPCSDRAPRSSSPSRCTETGSPSGETETRGGGPGRRTSRRS